MQVRQVRQATVRCRHRIRVTAIMATIAVTMMSRQASPLLTGSRLRLHPLTICLETICHSEAIDCYHEAGPKGQLLFCICIKTICKIFAQDAYLMEIYTYLCSWACVIRGQEKQITNNQLKINRNEIRKDYLGSICHPPVNVPERPG